MVILGLNFMVYGQVWKEDAIIKETKYYKDYGGRGIIVCDEWKNDYSKFKEWALANGYQGGVIR